LKGKSSDIDTPDDQSTELYEEVKKQDSESGNIGPEKGEHRRERRSQMGQMGLWNSKVNVVEGSRKETGCYIRKEQQHVTKQCGQC
jgi:hypothetical protein